MLDRRPALARASPSSAASHAARRDAIQGMWSIAGRRRGRGTASTLGTTATFRRSAKHDQLSTGLALRRRGYSSCVCDAKNFRPIE
jgi:hypothetical protein